MHATIWHSIWIIGAGRFGQLAASRICKEQTRCAVTLIDPDPVSITNLHASGVRHMKADGVAYLVERLDGTHKPDWIVPAAPVHVAYEWVRGKLSSDFSIDPLAMPSEAMKILPHPQPGGFGTLYVSNANWICPDDCPEPAAYCTFTGEAHPCTVYQKLQELSIGNYKSVVIRSRQLLPGVGGYTPNELYEALDSVQAAKTPLLLATACRCHGVINAFQLKPL